MIISSARATVGLFATTTPTSSRTSGALQVGNNNIAVPITSADSAYCVRAIFSGTGETMTLNLLTGVTSLATAFVAGAAQVDIAAAVGTVTVAGNASITVTAAGMVGSPKVIPVAVAVGDNANAWAAKVRAALNADVAVSAMFTSSGTLNSIGLTRKPLRTYALPVGTHNHFSANDATLNLALAPGTAVGITAAPTSADTVPGVITSGVRIYDDVTDFEGVTLTSLPVKAVLYSLGDRGTEAGAGRAIVDGSGLDYHLVPTNGSSMFVGNGTAALAIDTTVVVTSAVGPIDFSATVVR